MKRAILFTLMSMLFIGTSVYAQEVPFNLSEIIEKVSHHPLREDERIVIKDKKYEASFDQRGVTLKTINQNPAAKDLVIPIQAKPLIRAGKVVYTTKHGEIFFEGTNRGLKFGKFSKNSKTSSRPFNHSGNVAKLKNLKINSELLTGEFLLDSNFIYLPEPDDQQSPSIAFDGTNYLVVWQEERGPDNDIYGARVSQSGRILDPHGIPISTATNRQESPEVCFGDSNYFVVWEDRRSGLYNFDIYGARVSQSGEVLDSNGIAISTADENQECLSVIFGSLDYFVVWQDRRNGELDLYGARVRNSGTVLDTFGIAISTASNRQEVPSVSFDGSNYFVVWEDGSIYYPDIYGARVNQSGIVLDTNAIPIAAITGRQGAPSISFDGINYLVVWEDGSNDDIIGARVTPTGAVLDTGIPISTATRNQKNPSVAFDGANYLVVWQDDRAGSNYDIYCTMVSQTGQVLDTAGILISNAANDQDVPKLIAGNTGYLVVWQDDRSGVYDYDIYGTRVSFNGAVIDTLGIAVSSYVDAYGQWSPAVAFDGTNYLVVWTDERNDDCDIYATRVNQSGMILDPDGIPISTDTNEQYSASVTFMDTNYFVVWADKRNLTTSYTDIFGARVNQSGLVLDPAGIPISNASYDQQSPAITFGGENYLVVWQDNRNGLTNKDIYGARVNHSGVVIDPSGIIISDTSHNQEFPKVAFDGANYFVVWHDERLGPPDIYGTRVSNTGMILDPSGIVISNAAESQESTSVAFDGRNYLVVWQDRRGTSYDIYGARVNQVGNVLDPFGIPISTRSLDQTRPSVAFDRANYFIVWQDYGTSYSWDIYGAKLDSLGTMIDTFAVSTQVGNQLTPALAHGPENQLLIVYAGWTDSIGGVPADTMRIWGKLYPGPGIEEKSSKPNASRLMPEIYPNPFSKQTLIRFKPYGSRTELKIYDISGKLVKSFSTKNQQLITNNYFVWHGTDDSGRKLPAGVYIARFKTTKSAETKELILLR